MHKLALFCLLASALLLNACSSGNSAAPDDRDYHPPIWLIEHDEAAIASPDFSECTSCHGSELQGRGEAVSCFSCHAYNDAPPFIIHPPSWFDAYGDHRAFASVNGFDSCLGCHGAGLRGSVAAPSCFAAGFDGRGCHAEGPSGEVPHPLDGSFLPGRQHGPVAKQDLSACQPCHAEAGGPGDNPRFNVGIVSVGGGDDAGCESCHGVNYAHPQNWAGPNNTFHYSAGNIQASCTLCHGENLDGVGAVGVSCLECHASASTFTLDCTSCHGYPPQGAADVATSMGVVHGEVAQVGAHQECTLCHGMSQSADGGTFAAAANYDLFDKATDTLGDHWNGRINMNSGVGYDQTIFGCTACHGNADPEFRMSDSGLPVLMENY